MAESKGSPFSDEKIWLEMAEMMETASRALSPNHRLTEWKVLRET